MQAEAMANINPIVSGFNPDPSCICVDGVFYLVTSTFLYFPGIPVYTSRDLKTWTQIGNVISRSTQLDFSACRLRPGTQFSGGIWAPTIRHRAGVFYVVTTLVFPDKAYDDFSRWQNVVFSCSDPAAGEWSDPILFDFPGYDTSLFWDDDGKAYVQGSFYWRIRYEISQFEIDLKTGKSLSGEPKALWSGTGGIAPEAPHLYKKGETYFLLIAEGGTEFGHCATLASAPTVWGPFMPCPKNPIIRAPSKTSLFQTVGHADLFKDGDEQWWAVALASRVIGDSYPIGRESCLVKVDWTGQWPVADLSALDVPPSSVEPKGPPVAEEWQDILRPPHHHLLYLRNPISACYTFSGDASTPSLLVPELVLRPSAVPLAAALGSPTFIGVRQRDLFFECEAALTLSGPTRLRAGIAAYLDHEHFFAASVCGQSAALTAVHPGAPPADSAARAVALGGNAGPGALNVRLRIRGSPERYVFEIAQGNSAQPAWEHLGDGDCKHLSGGFTGVILALFAVEQEVKVDGLGKDSGVLADVGVSAWRYRAL